MHRPSLMSAVPGTPPSQTVPSARSAAVSHAMLQRLLFAPRGANNNRCNMACDTAADRADGTVCEGGVPGTADIKEGLCMEGVVPPKACVNAPQRYELRAGEAFVV